MNPTLSLRERVFSFSYVNHRPGYHTDGPAHPRRLIVHCSLLFNLYFFSLLNTHCSVLTNVCLISDIVSRHLNNSHNPGIANKAVIKKKEAHPTDSTRKP